MNRRRQDYVNKIMAYLSTNAAADFGKNAQEISEATGISLSSVYRVLKVDAVAFGIKKAYEPVYPNSYYVVPQVAIMQRVFEPLNPANLTENLVLQAVHIMLANTIDSNVRQLGKTMDGPIDFQALIEAMADNVDSVKTLALQAMVMIYHCERVFNDRDNTLRSKK